MKQETFETMFSEAEQFNAGNVWKKRGVALVPSRFCIFVPAGHQARIDIFKDGSVQIAVTGVEVGQGLHVKVAQAVTTEFCLALGCGPPLDVIRFRDASTEQSPNGLDTCGSTSTECCVFAAVVAVGRLVQQLQSGVRQAKNLSNEFKNEHPTNGLWFDIIWVTFCKRFLSAIPIPPNLSASAMHYPKLSEVASETYGVASAEVELDVLTGEWRVRNTHILYDIGDSFNSMVDCGQVEGAFVMGMGQIMQEGMDYDKETGRCLTDNTWSYEPPVACDVPEVFKIELVDFRGQRKRNRCVYCTNGVLSAIFSCFEVPWKPSKIRNMYKTAKCSGEPALLLSQAVHSAHLNAVINARDGPLLESHARALDKPLPDNKFPIPARPFSTLPFLADAKPGWK